MSYNFTKEQIEHAYNVAKSASGAARLLGVKIDTYRKYAEMYDCYRTNPNKIGIPHRPFVENQNMNIHYFDTLDSSDKAYILGFLLADGTVHYNSVVLSVASRDREVLEYICTKLNVSIDKIVDFDRDYVYKGTYRKLFGSRLCVNSKHMVKTLGTYGLVVNRVKNNFNLFEHIPDNMKFSCLVGYIDGNGSFPKSNNTISIASSKLTCSVIYEFLSKYDVTYRCILEHPNYSELRFSSNMQFVSDYLSTNEFILSRKRLLAQSMLVRLQRKVLRSKTNKISCTHTKSSATKNIKYCMDCGVVISYRSIRCKQCAKLYLQTNVCKRPNRDELVQQLLLRNFSKISKIYGVSDNAIRKWCKFYQLPSKTSELRSMSDMDILSL